MPITDSYGQGISLTNTTTDAPDLGRGIQDLAAGVIPRGTLRFASASARGATLVGAQAPVDGMLTWLEDVGRLELRVDGVWVVVAVGNRAWTTIALASGWTQNGNAQGTFQYRIVNLFGEDSIMFRGGISRSSYPTSIPGYFEVNTNALPAAARPASLRTIIVPCSDVGSSRISLKLDVTTDGWLRLYGISRPNDLPAWVGFNGCFASL
ncbi:hypothetical protein ACIQFU_23215 [Streptomyces sp. NPDC093065]|uniref:hypothetical protein n=1 Tax=Streptomyces sp. NPDC093065 TaxID=3366021 RepID=UPI00381785F0